jgi:hypothetical protein
VGPVSSAGVGLWIAYARTVIGGSLARPDQALVPLRPDVVEAFEDYLEQWEQAATYGPTFVWETDIDPERIAALGSAWFAIAERLASVAERRGYPISPPEGEEFYQALIAAVLDALEAEGGRHRELAEQMRGAWPGFKAGDVDAVDGVESPD